MAAMETLSEAMARLVDAGYSECYAPVDGALACARSGALHDPSAMSVTEIVRFEGVSNPDDQAILYALDAGDGHRGLYAAAYGATSSAEDVAVLRALPSLVS